MPSTSRLPVSGVIMPKIMRMSVDLPAPFSPTMAWTSPRLQIEIDGVVGLQ